MRYLILFTVFIIHLTINIIDYNVTKVEINNRYTLIKIHPYLLVYKKTNGIIFNDIETLGKYKEFLFGSYSINDSKKEMGYFYINTLYNITYKLSKNEYKSFIRKKGLNSIYHYCLTNDNIITPWSYTIFICINLLLIILFLLLSIKNLSKFIINDLRKSKNVKSIILRFLIRYYVDIFYFLVLIIFIKMILGIKYIYIFFIVFICIPVFILIISIFRYRLFHKEN